ncbi:hypothetical protein CANINC_003412 [Pichia inconspicua]|uniref:4'-phosphopantetheinyl transferase domain-containing protein n=1 Tax=Pichia inconspicua TaxID=52247 RepID=A0A4T0WYW3_9ASCO|nr:hypothetical protein CANINC_003412 [[Candida] inconspicua]
MQNLSPMNRVISIGTDLHRFSRVENILKKNGPLISFKTKRFADRVLNPIHEKPLFQTYVQNNDILKCSRLLSTSWCVKEAIYKTLDDVEQANFSMSHWYKISDERGRPIIGNNDSIVKDKFLCSISHDGDLITAFVLRIGQ